MKTKDERIVFTKEMKKSYKILAPMMMPSHFRLFIKIFRLHGYDVDLLETDHPAIVTQGLRSVHNDTCYPALLVIGQLIEAIKSGKYDPDKTALMISQTGGGCRASNYIHLLRKALIRNNLGHVPVISVNLSGLEKNSGFKLTIPMLIQVVYSVVYGDMLMWISNQCRPYEVNKGQTDRLVEKWEEILGKEFESVKNLNTKKVRRNIVDIVNDFKKIELKKEKKVRVGVVGEIYVKYAPLGNNNLERFLASEGCEVIVPGLMDFFIFKLDNRTEDIEIYGGNIFKYKLVDIMKNFMLKMQKEMKKAIDDNSDFHTVANFENLKELVKNYMGYGNKMGEGWLLTAEMVEFCHAGVNNVVCTQPFGCLPNHIAGKGMMRKIKEVYPDANIVAIDYDPGATQVNQENRIKLMLANAKKGLD
jgi:predicted nucleotide-binding protein (sugar kinase/HSP70/actin superfamily)